jgi:hypothetical protein
MFELGTIFPYLLVSYQLTPYDLVLFPIYFAVIYFLGNRYRQRLSSDPLLYKYYGQALVIKLISSFIFCLVYMYYYGGGDTTGYYHWCNQWFWFLFNNPSGAFSYLFIDDIDDFYTFLTSSDYSNYFYLMKYGSSEDFFIRIASVINVFGLNSFVCTSLIFGYLSFLGTWRLFIVFYDMYPQLRKQLALATLFIPSVVFWASGLMKDTLTLMGVCWLTYSLYFGLVKRQNVLKNVIWGLIMAAMTAKLKGYIILAFVPAAGYWAINMYKEKINSAFLRFVSGPFFILIAGVLVLGLMQLIGDSLGKYSIDKLEQTAEGYQSWHQETGGASYTIYGAGDFSAIGLLKTFPQGINVTLFRPYLWEAGSIFNLMAALESAYLFYFTMSILWRTKIVRLPAAIALDTNILFCLMFSLILAFAVGITSFNFGALVRYKIPVMPFYAIALILIDNAMKKESFLSKVMKR